MKMKLLEERLKVVKLRLLRKIETMVDFLMIIHVKIFVGEY